MKALYAQSGGVTSVINASAYGVIDEARKNGLEMMVGINGVTGILKEKFLDYKRSLDIEFLKYTPAGAFGSCRKKMKNDADIEKLFNISKRTKSVISSTMVVTTRWILLGEFKQRLNVGDMN